MAGLDTATLVNLSDTDQTVSPDDVDIRGLKIKDKDGEDVGKVDDLLIDDQERKVRFLVVKDGGFLGIGQTHSFIPVDAITGITGDEVSIDHSRSHVAGAPPYDPDVVTDTHAYYDSVYGYYGYTPYWGVGYANPGYPIGPMGTGLNGEQVRH